jgi:hypothetical protein
LESTKHLALSDQSRKKELLYDQHHAQNCTDNQQWLASFDRRYVAIDIPGSSS